MVILSSLVVNAASVNCDVSSGRLIVDENVVCDNETLNINRISIEPNGNLTIINSDINPYTRDSETEISIEIEDGNLSITNSSFNGINYIEFDTDSDNEIPVINLNNVNINNGTFTVDSNKCDITLDNVKHFNTGEYEYKLSPLTLDNSYFKINNVNKIHLQVYDSMGNINALENSNIIVGYESNVLITNSELNFEDENGLVIEGKSNVTINNTKMEIFGLVLMDNLELSNFSDNNKNFTINLDDNYTIKAENIEFNEVGIGLSFFQNLTLNNSVIDYVFIGYEFMSEKYDEDLINELNISDINSNIKIYNSKIYDISIEDLIPASQITVENLKEKELINPTFTFSEGNVNIDILNSTFSDIFLAPHRDTEKLILRNCELEELNDPYRELVYETESEIIEDEPRDAVPSPSSSGGGGSSGSSSGAITTSENSSLEIEIYDSRIDNYDAYYGHKSLYAENTNFDNIENLKYSNNTFNNVSIDDFEAHNGAYSFIYDSNLEEMRLEDGSVTYLFNTNYDEDELIISDNAILIIDNMFLLEDYIKSGLNLISNPYNEPITKSDLTSSCPSVIVDSLQTYNPVTDSIVDASEMLPGKGYLVQSTNDCDFTINVSDKTEFLNYDLTLKTGTNYIGPIFYGIKASVFEEGCAVDGTVEDFEGNEVDFLEKGQGYVVKLKADCVVNQNENYEVLISNINPISTINGIKGSTNVTIANTGNRHVEDLIITISDLINDKGDILEYTKYDLSLDGNSFNPGIDTFSLQISENETFALKAINDFNDESSTYKGYMWIEHDNVSSSQEIVIEFVGNQRDFQTTYPSISILEQENVKENLTFTNNGNTDLEFDLQNFVLSNNNESIDVTITNQRFELNVSDLTKIEMDFDSNSVSPGSYSGNLTVDYGIKGETLNESRNITITLEIVAIEQNIDVDYNAISVIQKDNGTTTMTIYNIGNVPVDVTINPTDLSNGNDTIIPQFNETTFTLNITQQKTVQIDYETLNKQEGNYVGNITVNYESKTDNVSLSLNVLDRDENLSVTYTPIELTQGNNITTSFQVRNIGNIDFDNVSFEITNLVKGTDTIPTELNINSLAIASGATTTVTFNITTTTSQVGTYNGTITTTFDGNVIETPINLVVNEIEGSLTIDFTPVNVLQGNSITGTYTITNNGNIDLNVNLSLENLTNGNDIIEVNIDEQVSIAKGDTYSKQLTFNTDENNSAGTYQNTLFANYQDQTTTQSISVEVEAINETITHTSSASTRWLQLLNNAIPATIEVTNNGNVALNIDLVMNDLTGPETIQGSSILIVDNNFNLAIGATESVTITPNILENKTAGTYTGLLNISYDGTVSQMPFSVEIKDPEYSLSVPSKIEINGNVRDTNQTVTFTVTNNGDYALGLISIEQDINDYNATLSPTTINGLAIDGSSTVTLNLAIPEDEATDNHKIGNIKLINNNVNTTIPVYLNPDSALIIEELEISVDGNKDEYEDEDTIDDEAKPGDTIKFELNIENLLENSEMHDVIVEIEIEDIDDGDDIDTESDEEDINEEDDQKFKLELEVPRLVDENTFEVLIHVEGEDDDNNIHEINWIVYLEVEKESHEIILDRASISPSTISCSKSSTVEVKIINVGGSDENVEVIVSNSELGLNSRKEFELEEGDNDDAEREVSFSINVPEDADEKKYNIDVKVYRDGRLDDSETLSLKINDCEYDNNNDKDNDGGMNVQTPTYTPPTKTKKTSTLDEIRDSDWYLPALGVVVVGIGVGIFAMIPK